ncbi:MAG: DUF1036 domain-containing protein [Hyphomonadaceae bacterium]
MAQVRLSLSAIILIAGWLFISLTGPAEAQSNRGWSVCNQTSFVIEAAVARPDAESIIVEGWTKLRPGSCEIVMPGPLRPGVHYLYTHSSEAHRGGTREWAGDQELCVDPSGSFSIENLPDCSAMGLASREFRPVLIERKNDWRTNLTETDEYSLEKARSAGIQRLLVDASVFSGAIDGLIRRRTRAAIAAFLEEKGLPADTSDNDLIDILEQEATTKARNLGLTLCNRTKSRVWSAIARRKGDGWESRGWWLLEAGGCARVIDEPLVQTEHFIYAEKDDDGDAYTLTRASDRFCISRSKFAILGRDACTAHAYQTALFASTPPPQDNRLVYEFFDRDFTRVRNGQ